MSSIIPRLTTERLVLRALERRDFDSFAEDLAVRVEPPGPVDRRTAWRMLLSCTGNWLIDGVGWFAIELAATSEMIGTCGAFYREAHPDRETSDKELELGWGISLPFRKKGYAREAAGAVLDYVRRERDAKRVIALIDEGNIPSLRVAEHIGMSFERDIRFYDIRLRMFAAT